MSAVYTRQQINTRSTVTVWALQKYEGASGSSTFSFSSCQLWAVLSLHMESDFCFWSLTSFFILWMALSMAFLALSIAPSTACMAPSITSIVTLLYFYYLEVVTFIVRLAEYCPRPSHLICATYTCSYFH